MDIDETDCFVEQVESLLEANIQSNITYLPIKKCLMYGLFAGDSKRIRPRLIFLLAKIFFYKNLDKIALLAAAIECLHSHSLMYDDLPAFDDDLLRRGEPSCHVAFGVPLTMLSGNCLLTFAFKIISESQLLSDVEKTKAIVILSSAYQKISEGQDIDCKTLSKDVNELIYLYNLKTTSLFLAAFDLTNVVVNVSEKKVKILLREFIFNFGIFFQAKDDLEDFYLDKKKNIKKDDIRTILNQSKEKMAFIEKELKDFVIEYDLKYLVKLFEMTFYFGKKYA